MSALDFGARALAVQARAASRALATQSTSPALIALAQGQLRPIDYVGIGDSMQNFDGHGFDGALGKAFGEDPRFGIWASPLYSQAKSGNGYHQQGYLTTNIVAAAGGAETGADAAFDDFGLPDATYLYTAAGAIGTNNGILISQGAPLDPNGNLRYHVHYGTFDSGAGSFQLGIRRGDTPYTGLGLGGTINTNTGAKGEAETTLDLAAGARGYPVHFMLQRSGGAASVGPTLIFGQRVRNLGRAKGVSFHSFYSRGGQGLWDMASFFQGDVADLAGRAVPQARIMWGFGKLRALQIALGHKPIIVIRICSGFNDKTEAGTPTRGPMALADVTNKALAYGDNLNGLIDAIEEGWTAMGWPLDEVFFHVVTSYPNLANDDMAAMRSAGRMIVNSRPRCSFTDTSILVPYTDTIANSGIPDGTHATAAWTQEMAHREIALIPTIEVVA